MRRFVFGLVLVLLSAAQAAAQSSILSDLQTARAAHCSASCSPAQLADILNDVAWLHRDEGVGLLAKPSGNSCPQPTTGILVSCDFLVSRPLGLGADVIGDSDGAARVGFSRFSESVDLSRFVAPVAPTSSVPPSSSGGGVPTCPATDLSTVLGKLDALAARLDALASSQADLKPALEQSLTAQIDLLRADLRDRAVAFPSYRGKVLGQAITLVPVK